MKKSNIFLYCAIFIIGSVLIGLSFIDTVKPNEDYPMLNKYNNITFISSDELIEKINNKESFVVTLGFHQCPWCQAIVPNLDLAAKNARKDIYYCDILEMRMHPDGEKKEDYEFLKSIFYDLTIDDHQTIGAPTTGLFIDGVFKEGFVDTVEGHVKNCLGVLPPLTKEQSDQLVDKLVKLLELV